MVFQDRNNVWKTAFFNRDENMDPSYLFIGDDVVNYSVCVCFSTLSQTRDTGEPHTDRQLCILNILINVHLQLIYN